VASGFSRKDAKGEFIGSHGLAAKPEATGELELCLFLPFTKMMAKSSGCRDASGAG
jgi:hypothetical protein